jgi:DNA-binding response OmpR family regulator
LPLQPILILDTDVEFAQMLAEQLDDAGLPALVAADVEAAMLRIGAGEIVALVIAAELATALSTLSGRMPALPVVVLAGARGTPAIIPGAEVVARPIRIGALISRLRALTEPRAPVSLAIGPYHFDSAAKRLTLPGRDQTVHLTEKETEILCALARAEAAAVPRDQLLREVWRYNPDVTTHTLETHIYRLRQKMETGAAPGPFLVTEGGGYRLVRGA